jgi:response regulator RpfG family c-di-GMP phosphodiesterase
MSYLNNFIIIDDDKLNNKLCRTIIEKAYPDSKINDFTDPLKGLQYISDTYSDFSSDQHAVLLLDIMMPIMNAWEFLEKFELLLEPVKNRVRIYILSSSIDNADMKKAQDNKYVEYYLIKPLTKESIKLIVNVLNKKMVVH